jgi:hypothetical protein
MFYEWLASRPKDVKLEVETVACGEVPECIDFVNHMSISHNRASYYGLKLYQLLSHIQEVCFPSIQLDHVKDNLDLRVEYLLGTIDENKWKSTLLYREKRRMKISASRAVLDMIATVISDSIRRMYSSPEESDQVIEELFEFIEYSRTCFDEVLLIHRGKHDNSILYLLSHMQKY